MTKVLPIGQDNTENFVVQKSAPLLALWQSSLTLMEFKILDAYLSRVNSHDSSDQKVRFEKRELENLLGTSPIHIRDLEKRIQHLSMIKIIDEENGFIPIALFADAVCCPDEYGQWEIELQCTQQAVPYVSNIDNIGYLGYKLGSVIHLKSRYSYLLFLYLEQNRYRSPWIIPLEELREYLGCTSNFYNSYTQFNKNILRRCQRELAEKSSYKFQYVPIRRGRTVQYLRFVLEHVQDLA